ncbi:hypothetical protein SAMN04515692_11553 [Leifsonia sp. CL147]|nr:hypothetical protein SAMN04515694_11555 [Leifsonia sp. CL154]SFL86632.1 hypothetical protein SAMN04515692_11553 [Leifsonia sp. CL147]
MRTPKLRKGVRCVVYGEAKRLEPGERLSNCQSSVTGLNSRDSRLIDAELSGKRALRQVRVESAACKKVRERSMEVAFGSERGRHAMTLVRSDVVSCN